MTLPCLVGGVTLPLGPDDVRDYLAQYGEVSTSRADWSGRPMVELLPWLHFTRADSPCKVGAVSAYMCSERWEFHAGRPGVDRGWFTDIASAVAFALGTATGENL